MVKRLRLLKGTINEGKTYSFGCRKSGWNPMDFAVKIPRTVPFTDIFEGDVRDTNGKPIALEEVAKELLLANRGIGRQNATGNFEKNIYGENAHWHIDYSKEWHDFFVENNLPIPEDRKSFGERVSEVAFANLEAQGLISRNFNNDPIVAPGLQQLEEAKRKHVAEKQHLEAENEKLKRELEALKEAKEQAKNNEQEKVTATKLKKEAKELV